MDAERLLKYLFAELALVSANAPNERLPKEEQSRCCVYAYLRPQWDVVCVERSYSSIDEGGRRECDVLAIAAGRPQLWLELKHCRCASGYQNKPAEERSKWEADLDKLRIVPKAAERYFLLVCFADFDLSTESLPRRGSVIQAIRSFHRKRIVSQRFATFAWRENDGISHIGAWIWQWGKGVSIGSR